MTPIGLRAFATVWRGPRPVPITWMYDPTDPYAVMLSIRTGRRVVTWDFCRELLAAGLLMPAGRGDILLEPGPGDTLRIELRAPSGHAVLAAGAAEAHHFLALTYQQVPLGAEALDLDDDVLAALCTGGLP